MTAKERQKPPKEKLLNSACIITKKKKPAAGFGILVADVAVLVLPVILTVVLHHSVCAGHQSGALVRESSAFPLLHHLSLQQSLEARVSENTGALCDASR